MQQTVNLKAKQWFEPFEYFDVIMFNDLAFFVVIKSEFHILPRQW